MCENNPNSCEYISWNSPKIGEKWSPESKEEKKEKTKTKKSRKKTTKRKTK